MRLTLTLRKTQRGRWVHLKFSIHLAEVAALFWLLGLFG
jgi:hypothetical protein